MGSKFKLSDLEGYIDLSFEVVNSTWDNDLGIYVNKIEKKYKAKICTQKDFGLAKRDIVLA